MSVQLTTSDERWQPGCRIFSMPNEFEQAIAALHREGVIAYATEAVFGLGCDPDSEAAVQRLLAIKQRPVEKGLILIAADLTQLQNYIDLSQLSNEQLARVQASWPGPLHLDHACPHDHADLADRTVRYPGGARHGPSSSAGPVPRLWQTPGLDQCQPDRRGACPSGGRYRCAAGKSAGPYPAGEVGGQANPSEIKDARTGAIIRPS